MLALQITQMKPFMSHLLVSDTFDIFLLESASITTANTYAIDGRMQKSFFSPEEQQDGEACPYEFARWKDMKALCFQLMKGKRTPLAFQLVLHLLPGHMEKLLRRERSSVDASQVKALVLAIHYDGRKTLLTTGSAYHTFLMNQEPGQIWDQAIARYLAQKGIAYEQL